MIVKWVPAFKLRDKSILTFVTKVSRTQSLSMRNKFKRGARGAFRNNAYEQIKEHTGWSGKRVKRFLSGFEVHHIIPISLGGHNGASNLALVRPDMHLNIHTLIDIQARDLRKGQRERIMLPRFKGLVWGLG